MCGIAGFAGRGSREALQSMGAALRRRGPDDEGFYESEGVGFAFRRLSIIDVSGGHQPLSNEDGSVWVMLNGEIYGFRLVRDALVKRGHRFTTQSDTEVIVHAYEEWGDACFERLNGMFAIALWDKKESRLVLARDRLGKKPLYWTVRDGTLWFASEIKALVAAGAVRRDIDLVSVGLYFRTDAVPTPRSIFQDVQKLEPASALSWRNGAQEKTWTFWSCPRNDNAPATAQNILEGLRESVDIAVRERLVSDVPLGLFLSGGIDSAVIAESASRQRSAPLKAFTIGFEEATHDERPAARLVANALGLKHYEQTLTLTDAFRALDEAVDVLDEPLADSSILPQLLLSRFTRQHVTVALSGDGGDELLLGYQHVPAHEWAERLQKAPMFFRDMAGRILSSIPADEGYFSLGFKTQRFARGLSASDTWSRDVAWRGACAEQDLRDLLLPEVAEQANLPLAEHDLARRALEAGTGASFWKAWTWGYLRTFLMDDVMVKVDRATMWHSLEARAPLLDERVVSYLLRVPEAFKRGKWKQKRLFQELVRGRVPHEILKRSKHGFAVPIAEWLRGPLAERLADLTSPNFLRAQGLFNAKTAARFILEHGKKKKDRRKELWALLMFQLWYRKWNSV